MAAPCDASPLATAVATAAAPPAARRAHMNVLALMYVSDVMSCVGHWVRSFFIMVCGLRQSTAPLRQ